MTGLVARLRSLAQRLANASQSLILAGVLITVADIAMRSVSNVGVPGTVDLMQLAVMWSALLAIPAGFLNDEHVAIDLFTKRLPARIQHALRLMALLLAAAGLALLAWYGAQQAWREHTGGDSTQTLGLPFGIYWLPLLAGLGLSALACVALAGETWLNLWRGDAVTASAGRDPGA